MLSRREFSLNAGLCPVASCGWLPVGQQKVYEHDALRGVAAQYLTCRIISFSEPANNLRNYLDTTPGSPIAASSKASVSANVLYWDFIKKPPPIQKVAGLEGDSRFFFRITKIKNKKMMTYKKEKTSK